MFVVGTEHGYGNSVISRPSPSAAALPTLRNNSGSACSNVRRATQFQRDKSGGRWLEEQFRAVGREKDSRELALITWYDDSVPLDWKHIRLEAGNDAFLLRSRDHQRHWCVPVSQFKLSHLVVHPDGSLTRGVNPNFKTVFAAKLFGLPPSCIERVARCNFTLRSN